MDFLELVSSRYSVRAYQSRPIEQEKLDRVLERVSVYYDQEVETAVKGATAMIEPLTYHTRNNQLSPETGSTNNLISPVPQPAHVVSQ